MERTHPISDPQTPLFWLTYVLQSYELSDDIPSVSLAGNGTGEGQEDLVNACAFL